MSRILITSGPTRQFLDPVRFLSNASSGQMGRALAEEALQRDHEVTVVTGPVEIAYRFIDGEAVNGVDYVGTDGTLTFNDGDATTTGKAISFSINADAPELAESFQIELEVVSGGGAIEDSNPVTVTIQG